MASEPDPFNAPKADIALPPVTLDEPEPAVAALAARSTRLWAVIVDALLFTVAAAPGYGALVVGRAQEELALLVIALGAGAFGVYQMYLISTTGQSIAKGWFGIKIVRDDGRSVGFLHGIVLRVWVLGALTLLPAVGDIFILIDAVLIFGSDRKCLHDQIARTKVICVERA